MRWLARVQVVPNEDGSLLVEIAVYKELEDLKRPDHSNAGTSTFRNDDSLDRFNDQTQSPTSTIDSFPTYGRARGPIGPQPFTLGWIPLGRDTALEQKMLTELLSRLGAAGQPGCMPPGDCTTPPEEFYLYGAGAPGGAAGVTGATAAVDGAATPRGVETPEAAGNFNVNAVPFPGVLSTRMRP